MKCLQIAAVVLVVAANLVAGKPQYYGYPYPGAPGYPYAPAALHALPVPVQDTPEVAAAKAAHFAAYNAAASGAGAHVPAVPGYPYGSPGYPYAPVAPHGLPVPVQDTPEVAAAKAAHFAAHAAATSGHHYG